MSRKIKKPVILHLASWYPLKEDPVKGIFIQRHIELLSGDSSTKHIVVKKSVHEFSVLRHLLSLLGFFYKEKVGLLNIIKLPQNSFLYRFFFWRFKPTIEKLQLIRLLKKYRPDLIHLHVVYGFGIEVDYAKKRFGIPFIISEHMGPFPFDWIQDKQTFVINPMQEATAVISVSNAQAKQIYDFTGVTSTVIPNVVNEKEFYYAEKSKAKDADVTLQIVFVGIDREKKGLDYLLLALPVFLQSYPNCKLHLVGYAKPERMSIIKKQIEKTGIGHAVQFHAQLAAPDLCKLHHECDFYVCSSEWESFGLSVLEALFAGLPVLSTNCGGVPDFINSENGILITNDQKKETLINGLIQMTNQLSSFNREKIASEVRKKFSNSSIKDKYYSIYKKILQTSAL